MVQMWDERYSTEEYVYGKEPNAFFKTTLDTLNPGRILLPAEGEGRNAVYAANRGWEVQAFDTSREGRKKALALAETYNVEIQYDIQSYLDFTFNSSLYDAVGLFFTHQPAQMRSLFHKRIIEQLKPGGLIILECFHKDQAARDTGGPKNPDLLFSETELRTDFSELEILHLEVLSRNLQEGLFHTGEAIVIQLIARVK